jgi:cell division protein FtsI/penicillin-binding protein 2
MRNWRFYAVVFFILFCFGIIVFRLVSLQILEYNSYVTKALSQQETLQKSYAQRGEIYMQDRFSDSKSLTSLYPAVVNRDFYTLWAAPNEIKEKKETV